MKETVNLSKENELQEADVDINESMDDDLASFVDLSDLGALDDATNEELFGDLGDIADLGDLSDLSETDSSKEPEGDVPLPDISEDEPFQTAEPEAAMAEETGEALPSAGGEENTEPADVLPDMEEALAPDENEPAGAQAEEAAMAPLPEESTEGAMEGLDALGADMSAVENSDSDIPDADSMDVPDDILAMDDGGLGADIPALDDIGADEPDAGIPALDDIGADEPDADIPALDDIGMDIPALDDIGADEPDADIPVLDDSALDALSDDAADTASMDDALNDVMAAMDAVSDNGGEMAMDTQDQEDTSADSGIDSMLDGLLDNLDMTGSLDDTADGSSAMTQTEDAAGMDALDDMSDILGLDDIPFASDGQEEMPDDGLQDMLDVESMVPQAEEGAEEKEKKPGFFKRVFGNVVTDEIAEQERLEAEQAEEEAAKKAEEDEKAKEEKEAKKAEADAEKAAQKEEKKKQKEAKKAEKAAKKAEKKAQREEEEAAELEVVGRLNKVGVSIIVIATIIFLAVEITGTNMFGYISTKNKAKNYFELGKYTEAYQEAIGTNMRTKDPEEYNKIKVVMKVQQSLNAYQNYDRIGYYPEALNALIKGLKRYDANIDTAIDLDVDKDMMSCRKQILTLLQQEYNLSESDAYAILALDQTAYQKKVVELGLKKAN